MAYVGRVGRHHEEEHGVALNVAQEAQSEAFPFGGPFDDARYVGHDERLVAAVAHDAERGLHGGEGVVGNFRLRSRHRREERRLAGVGEADETHVAEELQLEHHGLLDGRLAGLCVARGAVGRRGEVPVAESTFSSAKQFYFLAVFGNVGKKLARLGVEHGGAHRHLYYAVFTVFAERASGASRLSVGSEYVALVAEVKQGPYIAVSAQDDVASPAAVASVGAAFGHIFGSVEMPASGSSLARAAKYLYVVYEVGVCHCLLLGWVAIIVMVGCRLASRTCHEFVGILEVRRAAYVDPCPGDGEVADG